VFELDDLVGCFFGEGIDCGGITEIVRPLHRIVGVEFPGVFFVECGVDASLCCAGVAPDRVEFGHERDIRALFVCCDCGSKASAAGADHQYIVFVHCITRI